MLNSGRWLEERVDQLIADVLACGPSTVPLGRLTSARLDIAAVIEELIRTRRTHKAFGPDPVPRETLLELFELARWAPNHHVTDPWRFRVLGPRALDTLKQAAEDAQARHRRRSSTARPR